MLCMQSSGFVTVTWLVPADVDAFTVNLTGSPIRRPRLLNEAENQLSLALWPRACLQVPRTHTVTWLPARGPMFEYTNTLIL